MEGVYLGFSWDKNLGFLVFILGFFIVVGCVSVDLVSKDGFSLL